MTTHALHHPPERSELARWLVIGALSGAISVLLFHQGMAALLHALGLTAAQFESVAFFILGGIILAVIGRRHGGVMREPGQPRPAT